MKPHWSGVFRAITTQLHKDGSLDLPATAAHADAPIQSGITGIGLLGSMGENLAATAWKIALKFSGLRHSAPPVGH